MMLLMSVKVQLTRVHSLVVLREAQRNIVRVVVRGVEPAHKSAKS